MNANLQIFLALSFVMAGIIMLLFLVNALFARKISAKIRYFMWVVIMIGLLIPLRPSVGNGVIDLSNFANTTSELVQDQHPGIGSVDTGETPVVTPEVSITYQDEVVNEQIPFQMIVFGIWLSVAIGIIIYHFIQYFRFQRSIKRWGELEEDGHTLALFDQVKQEMGIKSSKVKLIVCGFISTSMLTGFFKPTILLPEKNYDDAELELIFRHELIHYRRKDLWVKLLSVVAIAIHWFNPLVYLMNIALQTEGEASCDQEVLEMSKLKSPHFYAEVIIGMIGGKKSGMTTLATNFYGGKKGIKKRLEEIMASTTPHKWTSYVFLALIFMLTVMSGSVFAISTPVTPEENTPEMSVETNDAIFELAISAVGGGVVTDYLPFSEELMFVFVTYKDVVYLVEIDKINHHVLGLGIHFDNDEQSTETNESTQPDTSEIATEIPTSPPQETSPPAATVPPPVVPPQEDAQTTEITREQAGEIALSFSGGRLIEVSRDSHHGRPAWWVETRANGMVHEFYICMETGAILEHESEIDD